MPGSDVERELDGIGCAAEIAWNLREWLRECAARPSLRSVLDSLLPRCRAKLASALVDAELASQASRLPRDELTAESLIAAIGEMKFRGGTHIRLPEGEPPDKWPTLARYRAKILAGRMVDEQGQLLFNSRNSDDLEAIERIDGNLLQQLWEAGEQLDKSDTGNGSPAEGEALTTVDLTERHRITLAALRELQAVDFESRKTAQQVAEKAGGRNADGELFKSPIAELVRLGFLDSRRGRGGGCWLTDLGKMQAEKR